jgi:hypothetical protein
MGRLNHNANYIFDVEGETVWEKLRVIRGILLERQTALALAKLNIEYIENGDKTTIKYKRFLIEQPQQIKTINSCEEEIKFLREYEQFLATEAEKTRIPGKSDDEMYEINFYDELKIKLTRKAQAQMISYGRLQDDLMYRLLKHEDALKLCISEGILSQEVLPIAFTPSLPTPNLLTTDFLNQQLLTNNIEENSND